MNLLNWIADLLFPPKCPFCHKLVARQGMLCPACERSLPWTGDAGVRTLPGGFPCAAPLYYEEAVRETLLHLKFKNGTPLADPLGGLIAQCAAEAFSGSFDVVTWTPVSAKRRRERGYDQAELLARAVCRRWETKPEALLVKTVDTPAQSGLRDAAARRGNVIGVYAAASGAAVAGRRVLLVDDICTTGSTLAECARVLRDAGAASVVCAAAAVTRPPEK